MKAKHKLVLQADQYRERVEGLMRKRIDSLADRRMRQVGKVFAQQFPKRRLNVRFGMGVELVLIDRYTYDLDEDSVARWGTLTRGPSIAWRRSYDLVGLFFLRDAIEDVREITSHYREGCPEDLIVEPAVTLTSL